MRTVRERDLIVNDGDVDLGTEMAPEERAALEACIDRGLADAAAGRGIPAERVLAQLHSRR